MPLSPGSRLDAYQIERLLGAGGMGEVWLATEVRLGRKVALKILPPDLTRDPTRVQRFEQEARAASALNHPNVCTIHALGQTSEGEHYIAMEYVEGETLRQRLSASRRLTIRESLDIAIQVAAALSAAHTAGIIHRDIKPENVMVRPDGFVKVLDFGLAKLAPAVSEIAGADATRTVLKTEPGIIVGTAAYMSPEQARGQDLDARTDIWSLGVLLYEMVAGRSPFAGPSATDALAAILDRDPPLLAGFQPQAPAELQRIITKTLRKDSSQRYQTTKDLELDLRALGTSPAVIASTRNELLRSGAERFTVEHGVRVSPIEYLTRQVARHRIATAMIASALAVLSALVWWIIGREHITEGLPAPRKPILTRLTAQPSTLPLRHALISPDGKYLAYDSATGIQVRLIDTGESQRLPNTTGFNLYGWSDDSSKVRASACNRQTCAGWTISLVGDSRYPADGSWPLGEHVVPIPGGSGVLRYFARPTGPGVQSTGLSLDTMDGTPPRILSQDVDLVGQPAASSRVFFTSQEGTVYSAPATGGTPIRVWRAPHDWVITGLVELRDHRVIVAIRSSLGCAVYELLTSESGEVAGEPRRLTDWLQQEPLESPSVSSDGTRLIFLRRTTQTDIYIGEFNVERGLLSPPTRLTLDDRGDDLSAWTPDSRSVLFASNRNGDYDLFRQDIGSDSPTPIVVAPGDQWWPRVSDGRWVLFFSEGGDGSVRLMRVPLPGGASQVVRQASRRNYVHCPLRGSCIFVDIRPRETIVTALDPIRGAGAQLGKWPVDCLAATVTPDGARVGFVTWTAANRIHIVSLADGSSRDVTVNDATQLVSLDALSAGSGFVATDNRPDRRRLLLVRPDGATREVWAPDTLIVKWAIPSPDAKHLAVSASAPQADAWMMTNF